MIREKSLAIVFMFLLAGIVASGCVDGNQGDSDEPPVTVEFTELETFESYDALKASFNIQERSFWDDVIETVVGTVIPLNSVTTYSIADADDASVLYSTSAPQAESGDSASKNYSETNVQVQGVDEADIVKTDGTYIYTFSAGNVFITKAYPIESAEVITKIELEKITPTEMFIAQNKLVVFGYYQRAYEQGDFETGERLTRGYYPYYSGETIAVVYDTSDKSNPVKEKEMIIEGNYKTSRMIDDTIHFVVNSYPRYQGGNIIPLMEIDGTQTKIAEATEIGILPRQETRSFLILGTLHLEDNAFNTVVVAGNAETVYASAQHLYIASNVWDYNEKVLDDITTVVEQEQSTAISKFGFTETEIGFLAEGTVPGYILNQFSLDEFKGNFRIATTKGEVWDQKSQSTNNIYVLNENMKRIGTLEDLAPGERIYSARFMGEKGYIVTFKKVDPLFVIDLSDAHNPKVLGKLKIPGYSDYLHPIDETHLIGVGKDTIESKQGDFAWYQGMKLAIFDVSDVKNPKQMHSLIIGDRGTDSFALQDHKAFMYDNEKELLVLPITLHEISEDEKERDQQWGPSYGQQTFQGAFVYKVTLENGFEEKGRITHVTPEEELKAGYYYQSNSLVKRALYIGEVLYTVSDKMMKAHALRDLHELRTFNFNDEQDNSDQYWIE